MGDLFDLACREVYPATKQSLFASRPRRDMETASSDKWVPELFDEPEINICCIDVQNTKYFVY
jgi:hypothetical protein